MSPTPRHPQTEETPLMEPLFAAGRGRAPRVVEGRPATAAFSGAGEGGRRACVCVGSFFFFSFWS